VYQRGIKDRHRLVGLLDQQRDLGAPQYDTLCAILLRQTIDDLDESLPGTLFELSGAELVEDDRVYNPVLPCWE